MGLGRRADAAALLGRMRIRIGEVGRRGAIRLVYVERTTARDRVRRNLADFHSCSRASELDLPIQVGTNHRP